MSPAWILSAGLHSCGAFLDFVIVNRCLPFRVFSSAGSDFRLARRRQHETLHFPCDATFDEASCGDGDACRAGFCRATAGLPPHQYWFGAIVAVDEHHLEPFGGRATTSVIWLRILWLCWVLIRRCWCGWRRFGGLRFIVRMMRRWPGSCWLDWRRARLTVNMLRLRISTMDI